MIGGATAATSYCASPGCSRHPAPSPGPSPENAQKVFCFTTFSKGQCFEMTRPPYTISHTSLRLGLSTSMALLRLRAPSGMNGGLSCTQEETFNVSPFTSGHTEDSLQHKSESSDSLPFGPSWRAWPGGAGSGRRAPSCPSSWSRHEPPGAGRRPGEGSAVTQQLGRNKLTEQPTERLTSFFTCMTPSSVSVLVSITLMPSADSSVKTFCGSEVTVHPVSVRNLSIIP